jgi:hypothetical protein
MESPFYTLRSLWFMPRLTPRYLYFAVTVAPGFRDDPKGKSILRRYRTELTLVSVLALMAFVAGVSWLGVWFVPGGFFMMLAASFVAFYRADSARPRSPADHNPRG